MMNLLMQGSPAAPTYSDDVFSAYTYTGNGSTQTITNGIDLSTNGGLVWIKGRSAAYGHEFHELTDTVTGAQKYLSSNTTAAQNSGAQFGATAFSTTGFSIGTDSYTNTNTATYVSWTFREAAKFFDVVTYTGNGANRTIAHNLGAVPGLIIIKRYDAGTTNWAVYHRSVGNAAWLLLNDTAASGGTGAWNSTTPTATVFSLGTYAEVNTNAASYVAYLFGHDTTSTGLIQCGTYTGNGSATGPSVNLGWEAQWLMVKAISGTTGDWCIEDVNRNGLSFNATLPTQLKPNAAASEAGVQAQSLATATGFNITTSNGNWNSNTAVYAYVAIRRPNKPPTVGTQVYNAIARTGTGAAATVTTVGFTPDLLISQIRDGSGPPAAWFDRLRGTNHLRSDGTQAEQVGTNTLTAWAMAGATFGSDGTFGVVNQNTKTYAEWWFKRAPGVFDEVCYTGTGSNTTQAHELGVVPELIIVKDRDAAVAWAVYAAGLANTEYLVTNTTAAKATGATYWNSTTPTSTVFSIGTAAAVNTSAENYVAYLFATKAGISKVGSYTGDGTSGQTINCGFTTGARFVLIKRTDSTGDWFVWDSTRGIVAGNDPHLSLNTTAAEVTTDDSVDTDNSGFIVNQVAATNVNVNTATYIFLAFA